MTNFLETLRKGMVEANKKFTAAQQKFSVMQAEFQAAQQRLTAAQGEFQTAMQEFNAFQTLVNIETRKEQGLPPITITPNALPPHNPLTPQQQHALQIQRIRQQQAAAAANAANGAVAPAPIPIPQPVVVDDNKSESNKTEAVRSILRQHPAGMLPAEIWKQLQSQVGNRLYIYSVLKRLKDRGDVRVKRGKYYFNFKVEENQNHVSVQ
jgi:hypothetical protein